MDEWPTLAAATGADAADAAPPPASGGGCAAWGAAAAQRGAAAAAETAEQAVSRLVASCASSRGLAVAVVDANAAIAGGAALAAAAGRLVTVPEALEEVRDAAARRRLALLPAPIETVEPTPEFVKKVVKFARETGDLQTLSDVDIKIIALAYMLEAQIHGTSHLREHPPPLHVVNVRNLPEAQMPGWGSNVPNLAEWEALDQISEAGGDLNSRILPLKDLDNQEIPMSETNSVVETQGDEEHLSSKNDAGTACEKTVPHRINHSQREDTENEEGWFPAVSRSTHRRYLRRKARRDAINAFEESVDTGSTAPSVSDGNALSESNGNEFGMNPVDDPSAVQEQMKSNIDGFEHPEEENEPEVPGDHVDSDHPANGDTGTGNANTSEEGDEIDACSEELDNLEIKSETVGSVNTSFVDDRSSKQSWALRSLSESTVACVTSDYAMQNVILQIGLRLLAPGGMQIRQLHRWVLRCHACYKVTQEIGRIFCPKCGNGGTLRKVSVTVGENGITMAARRPRVILRGTKFSLPMPQGGREAITKNPVLREDQLPQKVLQLKSKKSSKKEENYLGADDIFSHSGEKRAPLKPPVRKALAMFSGKRNPNDNHFTRRKH